MAIKFLNSQSITGSLTVSSISNASSDTDKFLVSDNGIIKYRTGAQVLADIGAGTGDGSVTSVGLGSLDGISGSIANQTTTPSISLTNTDKGSAQNIFKNVAVSGQGTIVADSNNDTITLVGTGVSITTNATTDTITFSASNNYLTSATFNTSDGVLTLNRQGLSAVTVDLDGRYVTSSGVTSVATTFPVLGGTITSTGTISVKTPESGDWWNGGVPVVGTDGVMEIGKYIDFHATDTATSDFDIRLTATTGSLDVSGDIVIGGGDITLTGTGRIQGVDTVSAGTDAANKTYVDNAVSGFVDGSGTANDVAMWSDSDTLTDAPIAISGNNATFAGTVYIPSKLEHTGDSDTFLNFSDDTITLTAGNSSTIFSGNGNVTFPGDISIAGGDITSNGIQIISNSASSNHLKIGDISVDDSIQQIYLDTWGATQIYLDDNETDIKSDTVKFSGGIQTSAPTTYLGLTSTNLLTERTLAQTKTDLGIITTVQTANQNRIAVSNINGPVVSIDANTSAVSSSSSNLATGAQIQTAIDTAITGVLKYQGTWNASSNSPTLTSGSGTPGYYYIVSTAGSTNLDGITDWAVGDWAVFSDLATDAWQKIDNTQVGNVTGSGASGKVAFWNSSSNITSNSAFTYDGNNLAVGGSMTWSGGSSTESNLAYDRSITSFGDSGTSTVTLTIGRQDGNTLSTSFNVPQGTVTGTGSSGRVTYWNSSTGVTSNSAFTFTTNNGGRLQANNVILPNDGNYLGFDTSGNARTVATLDSSNNIEISNAALQSGSNTNIYGGDNTIFYVGGSEELRINNVGAIGIAGTNYGTSGQVLTSSGSGSNPTWSNPSTGSNNYVSSVSFNTSDGILTLNRNGLSALTVDLDGRYNPTIGTDTDINTSGYSIIDQINMTDGVITSTGARNLLNVHIEDTRAAEKTPNDYQDKALSLDFTDEFGSLGSWWSGITMKGWADNYQAWQLISGSDTSADNVLYFRTGIGTTWGDMHEVWGSMSSKGEFGDNHSITGDRSFALGDGNTASGINSVASGNITTASNFASVAFGYDTTASGATSMAIGALTTASGSNSFAANGNSRATGQDSSSFGQETLASGNQSFSIGYKTTASGDSAFCGGGEGSSATNTNSFAFGADVDVTAAHSAGFGRTHDISGVEHLVGGLSNTISGGANLVGGSINTLAGSPEGLLMCGASNSNLSGAGDYSLIVGQSNQCQFGDWSFTGGKDSDNFSNFGIAYGSGATASKANTNFAFGEGVTTPTNATAANDANQFVVGKYNSYSDGRIHRFSVGNGTSDLSRFTAFCVDNSSRVGIKDPTPSYELDVTGTIRATGNVIAFSDERVKENIKTIDSALDKVNNLRGVEFNKIGEEKKSIGVIAQEIEKILPEVVETDDKGMKSVAYGNIVGVLIEAVKEQQAQINQLTDIVEELTKRV